MQLMELYLWKRCFIIHDDFRNFTSPNGFFFLPIYLSFQTAAAVFLNGSACFSGLFSLSVEGLFWITINFQLMFMHSSWIQTAGFHWSTDLLTSTTLLRVMNYFDPVVTPTLKPSRLWFFVVYAIPAESKHPQTGMHYLHLKTEDFIITIPEHSTCFDKKTWGYLKWNLVAELNNKPLKCIFSITI